MKNIDLNGFWRIDYLSEAPYTGEEEPSLTADAAEVPVPGYWEDQMERFRSTPLHAKLHYNPLYTLQRYPQAGYVPDMALPNVVGCMVYARTLWVEEVAAAELWFGGVQNTVSAWINGVYLGRHEGYSACFSLQVPQAALKQGENRITLAVSNTRLKGYMERPVSGLTSRAANECSGGIYGDVELRFAEGLRDVWVTTAEDACSFTVHTQGAEEIEKTVTVYHGEQVILQGVLPAGETALSFSAEGLEHWSPACPRLYELEVLGRRHRFGIRRLTAEGQGLFLNGKPYYFRGICEHCYHPLTVHPTRDKRYYRQVIRTLKALGFNSIRFHTYIPMVEYMEAADELGMLMELETPNNTTLAEWREIVTMARRYTAPVLYSSGNEMTIDDAYTDHLRQCAALVHCETDSLFSPMSAMRGIEYRLEGFPTVSEPFEHNPEGLAALGAFSDVYNSFSLRLTSYCNNDADSKVLSERNAVYGKPLLSHEICIQGTYADLSLKDRYRGSRIGETELFTSVERHLAQKGLLSRAPLYYRNSARWQQLLRKHCFETVRRSAGFAGYDFLGDIDTHWHTFGYCVGMMNEFYELKAGETAENVRRYNSDTVLLCDLPYGRNFKAGAQVNFPLFVSHFGEALKNARLELRLSSEEGVLVRRTARVDAPDGAVTELAAFSCRLPKAEKPLRLTLTATLSGGRTHAENQWELYVFPKVKAKQHPNVAVLEDPDLATLVKTLKQGKRVVLLGGEPFGAQETSFQQAIAGRTTGHLATVIREHPALEGLPHEGFCGWQFREMMSGAKAVILEGVPYDPIIEIANTYKNARPEALLFEYGVGNGRLLVCSLNLKETDPAACWLKERLLTYAESEDFCPDTVLSPAALDSLCVETEAEEKNENEAVNKNDITA
ncbi:MAG: hypothetical protein IJP27_08415 [Clostridia bacterium]|nr:hypothetical protein [Clostridia bacterium]